MSAPRYSLSINGASEVSFESLRIQPRQRVRHSLRTDTLSVTFPRGLAGSIPLQPDDHVAVFLDSQPFFSGRVDERPQHLQGAEAGSVALQILGPWQWLEGWPALRDFTVTYDPGGGIAAVQDNGTLSGQFDLFRSDSTVGDLLSTGEQSLWQLMPIEFRQRANTSTVAGTVSIGSEFTVADIPAGQTPPNSQSVSNVSVAEVLRMCNRWQPNVNWWMDYSTTPPTLRALPSYAMALSGGVDNYFVGIDRTLLNAAPVPPRWDYDYYVHSEEEVAVALSVAPGGLATFRGGVRWDLVPSVVTVRGSNGWTQYPSGLSVNDKRAVWLQRSGSTPPTKLVEYLYKSLATPRLEGSLVINPGTGFPSPDARPGRVWDLIGDDDATARGTAVAATTSVSDDLMSGITTCELGLPRHLGVGELLSLTLWAKLMA